MNEWMNEWTNERTERSNNYSYRLGTSEHDKSAGSSAVRGPRTWKSGGQLTPWTPWLRGPCMYLPSPYLYYAVDVMFEQLYHQLLLQAFLALSQSPQSSFTAQTYVLIFTDQRESIHLDTLCGMKTNLQTG